jgi:hypothetical protein
LGKPKCGQCDKFGHAQKDCWFNKNSKWRHEKQTGKENGDKRSQKEEANEGIKIEEVQHIAFPTFNNDPVMFSPSDEGQYFNFDQDNVYNSAFNNEQVLYYDWLADSATTLHILLQFCPPFSIFLTHVTTNAPQFPRYTHFPCHPTCALSCA